MDEIKKLIEEQGRTFEAFKAANDQMQSEIKKLGIADAATAEQVKKLNDALDAVGKKLADAMKRSDELEARLNVAAPAGIDAAAEAKNLAAYNAFLKAEDRLKNRRGGPLDADGYRAHRKAAERFLRYGQGLLEPDELKTLQVGVDPDGGYWVTPDVGGRIVQKVFETSDMRAIASAQAISTDALEGVNDLNEANAGWTAETGTRSATSTPQVGKWRIPVHEMYAMPEATQQLLDDAMVDVEGWLAAKVADKMARTENTAFVTGNGVGKPRGFASYATAATADASRAWGVLEHLATGTSAGFGTAPNGSDKLIELVHKLKSAYRTGARWAMTRTTVGEVRKLKANGEYIWLPSMVAGQPATLLGYPVSELEDMAAIAADSLSIAFGNFAIGYQIVDRQGIRVLRDPFTNKPYVRFYTTRRVGGDVLNFEALKFLKFGTS